MNKLKIAILFSLGFILGLIIPIFLQSPQQNQEPMPDNYVIRVIDGDTIEMSNREVVRLLCINTPEIGEEGYEEAKTFLENLILNKEIILESDKRDKDNYNRLLRYVYINQSNNITFVNKEIYQNNYANLLEIPPSITKCSEISSFE